MYNFSLGLLNCSVCDSDLELQGKDGVVLCTECPSCGLSSNSFLEELAANVERNKPREVEVYHLRK